MKSLKESYLKHQGILYVPNTIDQEILNSNIYKQKIQTASIISFMHKLYFTTNYSIFKAKLTRGFGWEGLLLTLYIPFSNGL